MKKKIDDKELEKVTGGENTGLDKQVEPQTEGNTVGPYYDTKTTQMPNFDGTPAPNTDTQKSF